MKENIETTKEPYLRPVVTLIIYNNGKILLQKREDNGCWAIHGGGIELGEQYIDTLNREIQEELNIKPINPELMGIYSGKDLYRQVYGCIQPYLHHNLFRHFPPDL